MNGRCQGFFCAAEVGALFERGKFPNARTSDPLEAQG
jgi:hypothetical protein